MDAIEIGKAIKHAREKAGFSQEVLTEHLSVTVQKLCEWERGECFPDIDNLMKIAEATNVPYYTLLDSDSSKQHFMFSYRGKLFKEENMFSRMREFAIVENLSETYGALHYMRDRHLGQFRKAAKFETEKVLYINHPLLMACQAHAFGIRDDNLFAAILLHDVVEDTGMEVEDLPFNDEVKTLVDLVTKRVPAGMTKLKAKQAYFERIKGNGKACVIKVLDRCNNISTMAGSFSKEKLTEYIEETENYIFPLLEVLKWGYPEYNNMAFLLKYQMISILETIKYLLN